jgi:hypothetical protein
MSPAYMQHLEKVVVAMPNIEERITRMREMIRRMAQARAAAATEQTEADAAKA